MSHRTLIVATGTVRHRLRWAAMFSIGLGLALPAHSQALLNQEAAHPIVLHAARLLEIDTGRMIAPGEILVEGERIVAVGSAVSHPADARLIDLGDSTLLPGLI